MYVMIFTCTHHLLDFNETWTVSTDIPPHQKNPNSKLNENPSSGEPGCPTQTDTRDEANSRFSQFYKYT